MEHDVEMGQSRWTAPRCGMTSISSLPLHRQAASVQVARLQSLRHIHEESADAVLRLQRVEKTGDELNATLEQSKVALDKVRERE